jgi:hypothetical protein
VRAERRGKGVDQILCIYIACVGVRVRLHIFVAALRP